MSENLINVPLAAYQQMAAAPLQLAQMEAAELLRRGDSAGANARIAAGVQQAAAFQAQVQASQAAAPVVPQPAAPPPSVEQRVGAALEARLSGLSPIQRSMMPPQVRADLIQRAHEDAGVATDPRFDVTRPYGLGPFRR